jgi:pimeloyl-ACP methyl ester carboxylesterase
MERLGRDAVGVLDHLKIEKTNWCGLSMGGMVGLEPMRSLALTSEFVRANGIKAMAAPSMERWFSAEFRERDPATTARATEMLLSTDLEGSSRATVGNTSAHVNHCRTFSTPRRRWRCTSSFAITLPAPN